MVYLTDPPGGFSPLKYIHLFSSATICLMYSGNFLNKNSSFCPNEKLNCFLLDYSPVDITDMDTK